MNRRKNNGRGTPISRLPIALLFALLLFNGNYSGLFAQPNIARVEYFFNTDPGFGLGTEIPLGAVPSGNLSNLPFTVNTATLGTGIHQLFVRVKDVNEKWSLSNRTWFYKAPPPSSSPAATQAEYFFDHEPAGGFGSGHPIDISGAGSAFSTGFAADVASLGSGIHHLFVRVKDANGQWSLSNRSFFYKAATPATLAPNLVKAEYFIDTDPGFGNGIPVPISPSGVLTNGIIQVAVHGLSNGTHRLYLRMQHETGKWSITNIDEFEITDAHAAPGLTLTGTSKNYLCAGQSITVGFDARGTFNPGNIFSIELSNATGSFVAPTIIGTATATASGTISCLVPAGLSPGTGYRMRAVSSSPVVTSPLYIGEFYKGCPENGPLTVSLLEKTDIACNGESAGAINISIAGGGEPFAIQWTKTGDAGFSASSEDLIALTAGEYVVVVTDDNGASETLSVEIIEPPLLLVNSTVTQMACGQPGAITLTIGGGTGGYTVNWEDGPVSLDRTGLLPGTYIAEIKDANGCTKAWEGTIVAPAQSWQAVAATPFNGTIANNTTAALYDNITFGMVYTESNNIAPGGIYPRLQLDYEGDGNTNGPLDRNYQMIASDDADHILADGKQYEVTLNDLPAGTSWKARTYVQTADGCILYSDWFDAPEILEKPNLQLFASDIRFSKFKTNPGEWIDVFATIHNTSPQTVHHVSVALTSEQNPAASYTVQQVAVPANSSIDVRWTVQTPDVPAWVPMRVWVDNGNSIDESNEEDNNAVRAYINGNYPLPGRIEVTISPVGSFNTCPGNLIRFTGRALYRETVIMDGTSVAGATVKVTLTNTGAVYNAYTNDDGYFTVTLPALPAGTDYNLQASVTDYTLTGFANYQFVVDECPQPCSLPDLVTSVWWDPVQIVAGGRAKAKWSVTNIGNTASAPSQFKLAWTGTSAGNTAIAINALLPGQMQEDSIELLFSVSEWVTLSGRANAGDPPIEECSDRNNYATATLEVMPNLPDIIPVGAPAGNRYLCDDNTPLTVTLYNAGGVAAENFNTIVTIKKDGTEVHREIFTIPSIGPKGYHSFEVPYIFTSAGNHTFHVACDQIESPYWPAELITELNEDNNDRLFNNLQIAACKPDLVVAQCLEPLVATVNPHAGQFMTLKAVIRNDGNAPTTGDFNVRFYVSGNPGLPTHHIRTVSKHLMPGDTEPVEIPDAMVPAAGETLVVTVDAPGAVDELFENNNSLSTTLCYDLQPLPSCDNLVFGSGQRILQYQSLTPWVAVRNNGIFQAQGTKVKVSVKEPGATGFSEIEIITHNGVLQSCAICPSIISLNTAYTFNQTGTYTFLFEVDPDNDFKDECNESNNVLETTITVISSADMRILSQYINPSKLNPQPGESVSFDITYENKGRSNAGEPMKLKLLVDNAEKGLVEVTGLQTNDKATVLFADAWSSNTTGVHIVRAIIDAGDDVTESYEDNNEATRAIIVGAAANLHITRFEPDNNPPLNEGVNIYGDVNNQGSVGGNAELVISRLLPGGRREELTRFSFAFAAGETYPFTYVWRGNPARATLFATIENVSVVEWRTDDNEAMTQVGVFDLQTTTTPAQCGSTTGSIQVMPVNGSGSYTYTLVNGEELTPLATFEDGAGYLLNRDPGTYTIRVQDMESGQQLETTATIGEVVDETEPGVSNCPDNITTTNPIVTWSEPVFTDDCPVTVLRSHVPGSTFTIGTTLVTYEGTDPAGNKSICSFTVEVVPITLSVTISGTNTLACNGARTGTLTATPSGGKPHYTYLWSNGKKTQTITGLGAGDYWVRITDAALQTAEVTHTILQPLKVTGTVVATPVSCFGDTDGKLEVTGAGGTPGYTYSLNGGAFQPSGLFENLAPGSYTITIKDANGCTGFAKGAVREPALLTANILQVIPTCFGQATGSISVTIAGGTNPKSYSWTGPGGFTSTAKNIRRLVPGMYYLTITDAKGCTANTSAEVTSYNQYFSNPVVTNTTCRGGNDGAISLSPSGGSGSGFSAAWTGSNGFVSSLEDISGLAPGNYKLLLTDIGTGCILRETHIVGQPLTSPTVSATVTPVATCGGTGSISASASNGDAPFQFSLDGGPFQGSGLFTGVSQGTHTVTGKDAKGCTGVRTVTVSDMGTDPFESNNSRTTAKTINIGQNVVARIGTLTDQDWFKFTTHAAGSSYSVSISHPSVTYNTVLQTAAGVTVIPGSESPGVKNYTLLPNTTYVVQVTGAQSFTCYLLQVSSLASPVVEMLTSVEGSKEQAKGLTANAYPNPHKGNFTMEIKSATGGEGHIVLYDLQGRAVAEKKEVFMAGMNQVRWMNIPEMPFVYRVQVGKEVVSGKVLGIN